MPAVMRKYGGWSEMFSFRNSFMYSPRSKDKAGWWLIAILVIRIIFSSLYYYEQKKMYAKCLASALLTTITYGFPYLFTKMASRSFPSESCLTNSSALLSNSYIQLKLHPSLNGVFLWLFLEEAENIHVQIYLPCWM